MSGSSAGRGRFHDGTVSGTPLGIRLRPWPRPNQIRPVSTRTPRPASWPSWSAATTRPCTRARPARSRSSTRRARRPPASASPTLLDEGSLRRARRVRPAPLDDLRHGEQPPVRRRRGHRLRHGRRSPGLRVQPGRHGLRRRARRGVRREDRQGARLRDEDRLPGRRHQRGRRRAHPGRRGLSRAVRRDLLPHRAGLRCHPADLADHGGGRRRARLLARAHRLRRDGRQDVADVHHRPGRRQDRHRRGRHPRGARRRSHPQHDQRQRALPRAPTRTTRSTTSRRCCPTCRATTSTRCRSTTLRRGRRRARGRRVPRHVHPGLGQPALRHARDHRAPARRR